MGSVVLLCCPPLIPTDLARVGPITTVYCLYGTGLILCCSEPNGSVVEAFPWTTKMAATDGSHVSLLWLVEVIYNHVQRHFCLRPVDNAPWKSKMNWDYRLITICKLVWRQQGRQALLLLVQTIILKWTEAVDPCIAITFPYTLTWWLASQISHHEIRSRLDSFPVFPLTLRVKGIWRHWQETQWNSP